MILITLQHLEAHKKTLENGTLFPAAANDTIKILRSYKKNQFYKMDEETKIFLDHLIEKYKLTNFTAQWTNLKHRPKQNL
jgi:hypothetical protein